MSVGGPAQHPNLIGRPRIGPGESTEFLGQAGTALALHPQHHPAEILCDQGRNQPLNDTLDLARIHARRDVASPDDLDEHEHEHDPSRRTVERG